MTESMNKLSQSQNRTEQPTLILEKQLKIKYHCPTLEAHMQSSRSRIPGERKRLNENTEKIPYNYTFVIIKAKTT